MDAACEVLVDFLDGDDFLVDVNLILSTAESFLVFVATAVAVFVAAADDDGEGEDFLEDVFIGEMLGVVEEVGVAVAAEEAAAAAGIAVDAVAGGAATALSLFGAAD